MNLPFLPAVKKNWAKLQKSGKTSSGVYTIDPDGSGAFNVFCDQTTAGPVRWRGGGAGQCFRRDWKARLLSTVAGLITRMGLVTFGYFCWDWTGYTVWQQWKTSSVRILWPSSDCVCTFQRTFYTNLVCRTIYSKTEIHGECWIMARV